MMKINPTLAWILVIVLLTACSQPPVTAQQPTITQPPVSSPLDSTHWFLLSYLDESGSLIEIAPGSQVTIEFSAGQIGGSAGCNSYSGAYKAEGNSLSFGPIASTLMACEEPLMSQESAYLEALSQAASFQITAGQLNLLDAQGRVILIFSTEAPAASAPAAPVVISELLGRVWKWAETIEPSGKQVAPADPAQYTLQFNPDGGLKVQADCNLGTGGYTLEGYQLTIHVGITTLAMCGEGSLSGQFIQYLNKSGSFFFKDGYLYIEEIYDGATLKFSP